MTFAERLRQLRKEKNMTIEEVADAVGLARTTVFRYEKGIITNVPLETYDKLAELFGVCRPYLIGWSDDRSMTMTDVVILPNNTMFLEAYGAMTQEERKTMSDILIKAYYRCQEKKK